MSGLALGCCCLLAAAADVAGAGKIPSPKCSSATSVSLQVSWDAVPATDLYYVALSISAVCLAHSGIVRVRVRACACAVLVSKHRTRRVLQENGALLPYCLAESHSVPSPHNAMQACATRKWRAVAHCYRIAWQNPTPCHLHTMQYLRARGESRNGV